MTKIINIFGGPGAGKSVTAAGVFYLLQKQKCQCELAREFVKDLIWESRNLEDRIYHFGEQNHRQFILVGKVDYVVTDSPILMEAFYSTQYPNPIYSDVGLTDFAVRVFNKYDNINFLIEREDGDYADNAGRLHNKEQALEIDILLEKFLAEDCKVPFIKAKRDDIIEILKGMI